MLVEYHLLLNQHIIYLSPKKPNNSFIQKSEKASARTEAFLKNNGVSAIPCLSKFNQKKQINQIILE